MDHEQIRELVAHRTTPANRSEQEIAGYREVLSTIHSHPEDIRLTPNVMLQLHRDLFQFAPGGAGHWKSTENDIMARRPGGTSVVRFKPVPAHLTADAMDRLHTDLLRPRSRTPKRATATRCRRPRRTGTKASSR